MTTLPSAFAALMSAAIDVACANAGRAAERSRVSPVEAIAVRLFIMLPTLPVTRTNRSFPGATAEVFSAIDLGARLSAGRRCNTLYGDVLAERTCAPRCLHGSTGDGERTDLRKLRRKNGHRRVGQPNLKVRRLRAGE